MASRKGALRVQKGCDILIFYKIHFGNFDECVIYGYLCYSEKQSFLIEIALVVIISQSFLFPYIVSVVLPKTNSAYRSPGRFMEIRINP